MAAFATDANTVAHFVFDQPGGADPVPDLVGGPALAVASGAPGVIISPWGNARSLAGGAYLLTGADLAAAAHAALCSRAMQVDLVLRLNALDFWADITGLMGYQNAFNTDNVGSAPFILADSNSPGADGNTVITGDSTNNVTQLVTKLDGSGTSIEDHLQLAKWCVLTLSREVAGGGYTARAYVNGMYVGKVTHPLAPPALTANNYRLAIANAFDVSAGWATHIATMDVVEMRIRNVTPTIASVYDDHFSALVDATADHTGPVVSNVSPAPGVISTSGSWSFRVTDDVAYRRLIVTALRNGVEEVIYRGEPNAAGAAGFKGPFAAGSTIATVVAGKSYDFVVRRSGGWRFPPTFEVNAIDTSGNEGT